MKANLSKPDAPPVNGRASNPSSFVYDTFAGLESTDRAAREEIQHRAYAIWQGEGEPNSRDLAHWFAAEAQVMRVS